MLACVLLKEEIYLVEHVSFVLGICFVDHNYLKNEKIKKIYMEFKNKKCSYE